ncbi:Mannitol-specific phosphotransferase enzyme IIA component [Chromobacterium violaceum]|uniref:Mannitol-specific phosphotransferase enzyme IIA component n=1 Tax=Chromobacterium violaceum TaxID=536 RepID=A0A3S4I9E4_CHRVL|nr:Mannitol-specific phosphotransferase enzyme IIA component [Chromobacterium violaceum]
MLADAGCIAPDYIDSLLRREAVANTYLGNGIAIPHGMVEDRAMVLRTGVAILQIPAGLEWNPDSAPTCCARSPRVPTTTWCCCAS